MVTVVGQAAPAAVFRSQLGHKVPRTGRHEPLSVEAVRVCASPGQRVPRCSAGSDIGWSTDLVGHTATSRARRRVSDSAAAPGGMQAPEPSLDLRTSSPSEPATAVVTLLLHQVSIPPSTKDEMTESCGQRGTASFHLRRMASRSASRSWSQSTSPTSRSNRRPPPLSPKGSAMSDLLDFVIDRHGGTARWQRASTVVATVYVHGAF